ncbi:hypothetical protein OG900_23370 [Streptomyces sp. NBC_00433]
MARSTPRALNRGLTRGGLALALSCALAAPFLGPAAAAGAAADGPPPYDVVVPPVNAPQLMDDRVGLAGTTGYERMRPEGPVTWVPYDGGTPVAVPHPSLQMAIRLPDGSERMASVSSTKETLTDTGTGATTDVTLPGNGTVVRAAIGTPDGWAMLTTAKPAGSTTGFSYHLLRVNGSTVTDIPLTGIPQNATVHGGTQTAESGGRLLLVYNVGDGLDISLVDPVTGAVDTLPDFTPGDGVRQVVITADSIGWYSAGTVHLAALSDPRTETRTITLPPELHADTTKYVVTLTDSAILAVRSGSAWNDGRNDPLYSVPLTGGPATELLPDASDLQTYNDGGAVVRGGPDAEHWSAYRIPLGGGAPEALFPIRELTPVRYGLTLAQGRLRFLEGMPDARDNFTEGTLLYQYEGVAPVPQPTSAPHLGILPVPQPVSLCDDRHHCTVSLADGGTYGGVTYVARAVNGKDAVHAANTPSYRGVTLDSTGGRIVDASENYALYNSGSNGKQYIVHLGYDSVVLTRPIAAAALWGDTLWTATATRGKVDQLDLRSRYTDGPAARAPVTTDAPCVIEEVQALGDWLYWSCGANGPAGVYDRTAGKSVAVPAGPALLGDGFVLRHAGGELQVTDSRTGATRTVAALPAQPALSGGDRGVTWTVDKFRGQIAYTLPDATTHLIPSGIAPSPLTAQEELDPVTSVSGRVTGSGWETSLLLSGPAASWKLEVRPAAGGAAVHTAGGGVTSATVSTSWDGKNKAGHYVPVGRYTWKLTAVPANGLGPDLVRTGPLQLHYGLAVAHDYSDDGTGDLLGVTPAGRLDVRRGSGTGTVLAAGSDQQSGGWPTGSRYVPIGDVGANGVSSLLVRSSAGVLTRYTGYGRITTSSPHLTIGGGWNTYNLLTSPGDLTADGRPDLVARDAAGKLYLYAGTDKGSFSSRVLICGGWQGYNLIAGDPAGGLLARDTAGVLWRYSANGKGGVLNRVRIGGGWQGYNALVPAGDLTGDGVTDLLARDTAGVLWRYSGDGKGSVTTPRARLGSGWQMYTTLL